MDTVIVSAAALRKELGLSAAELTRRAAAAGLTEYRTSRGMVYYLRREVARLGEQKPRPRARR
jgi:hypothetical protein